MTAAQMIETNRRVTSPAGDSIELLSDDLLRSTLPLGDSPGSLGLALQLTPQRLAAVGALWRDGAAVDRRLGHATAVLIDRIGDWTGKPSVLTNMIAAPVFGLCIVTERNAKRTYSIRLVALPERWLGAVMAWAVSDPPAEPEPERAQLSLVAAPLDERVQEERRLELARQDAPPVTDSGPEMLVTPELADAVATSLLAKVIATAMRGNVHEPELARLREVVTGLERRLGTSGEYVDKLRRDLRETGEELVAVKVERDGLRTRLAQAEHNLKVATSGDAQRFLAAEARKHLDRVMRQAPGTTKGDDDR